MVITTPNNIRNLYFEWLCLKMDVALEYTTLMGILFDTEFVWSIPNDDNRASDGLGLREEFIEENRPDGDIWVIDGPCSVLEMMIALACRMDSDIMWDPDLGDRSALWFWTMVCNLKLDRYSDDQVDLDANFGSEIRQILSVFLNREYAMNGDGGLFPLVKPEHNQRRVEIWYQMHAYIQENYSF